MSRARPVRVLYADDLKELRELLEIVLRREGHHIETVADGLFAYEKIAAQPDDFDLLITDHHMVNVGGLELVERVRTTPYRGKIMVFSSELSPAVHQKYVQHRVDRIVQKPVFPSALRSTLAEMFPAEGA